MVVVGDDLESGKGKEKLYVGFVGSIISEFVCEWVVFSWDV